MPFWHIFCQVGVFASPYGAGVPSQTAQKEQK